MSVSFWKKIFSKLTTEYLYTSILSLSIPLGGWIGGGMGEALNSGIFIWQEKCPYVMPHQNQFPASVFLWTWAIWDYDGSFSLSTWLICHHLGQPLQGVSVMVFIGSLTEKERSTLSLGGTITIPKVLERMNKRTELSPSMILYLPPDYGHHLASCLVLSPQWLQPLLPSCITAVIDGDFKINPMSLQLLLSGISHSDKEKMPSTGSLWHCCNRGLWEENQWSLT